MLQRGQRTERHVARTRTNAIPAGAGGRASTKRTAAPSSAYDGADHQREGRERGEPRHGLDLNT